MLELTETQVYLVRHNATLSANDIYDDLKKGHHDNGRPYSTDLIQSMQTELSEQVIIIESCNEVLSNTIDTAQYRTLL